MDKYVVAVELVGEVIVEADNADEADTLVKSVVRQANGFKILPVYPVLCSVNVRITDSWVDNVNPHFVIPQPSQEFQNDGC